MLRIETSRLLKIKEVAAMFGVHRRTVDGWRARGLESIKTGRCVRISMDALERFSEFSGDPEAQQRRDSIAVAEAKEIESKLIALKKKLRMK